MRVKIKKFNQGLKASWKFGLGSLLIFVGLAMGLADDWDFFYRGFLLLAGIFFAVLSIMQFAESSSDRFLSDEEKLAVFIHEHAAPEEKQKYLALAAWYLLPYHYPTNGCLKRYQYQSSKSRMNLKQTLIELWGIESAGEAKEELANLLTLRHRSDLDYQRQFELLMRQIKGEERQSEMVKDLVNALSELTILRSKNQKETIAKTYIYECQSPAAWDYMRGVNLACLCHIAGYLDEETTWEYIMAFNQETKNDFENWEEVSISYLLGRCIWSNDYQVTNYVELFSRLFARYTIEEVQQEDVPLAKYNIYQKFKLAEM